MTVRRVSVMPDARRVLDREFWRQRRRRLAAGALTQAMGLIGASPRLRGLALRALLDQHLAAGVLCLVPFDDHELYVDPRDDKIALKVMAGRCWQRSELDRAIAALRGANALRTGGVFIDVGANIGSMSIYALKSGVFSRAIAIEPDPHNVAILTRNFALNGLAGRACAIAAAASAATGALRLIRHRKNHGAHSVESHSRADAQDCIGVPAVTLEDVLARQAVAPGEVALVKIDVEGHELAVLEGMGPLLQAHVPILVELTADRSDGERLRRFKARLCPHYDRALDLSRDPADTRRVRPLPDLEWHASQADLLIY